MPVVIVFLCAAGIIAVDQILKAIMLNWLAPIGQYVVIPHFFSLLYVENRGAAFGILQNQQWPLAILTAIVCVVVIVAMFRYHHHDGFSWAACALILGGGIGNIIDRVTRHFVVDYLSFSFFPPIFNFADICVVAGAVGFVIHILRSDRKVKKDEEQVNA
jgi:signal peptidase II